MIHKINSFSGDVISHLPWDSEHFGFPVAQICLPELDDSALYEALCSAREKGFELIYWTTWPNRYMPLSLLRDFSGMLVDRKAALVARWPSVPISKQHASMERFRVLEYPRAPSTQRLYSLAATAGSHSRFNLDPRVPQEKFEGLYRTWINRSTLREIADVVLVAVEQNACSEFIGMITISEANGVGSIGLMATLENSQRKGVGTLLLNAAHQWMFTRGAKQSTVITQLGNVRACKFYERSGYRLADVKNYYHFWIRI